jgi:glycosyltransferase involved in cell wall biosynthesis
VDDGSTDLFTQQLLPRIDSSTIRVVRTANKGVSAARNLGIKLTTAPYLLLLDADDWLDPTYFEKAGARLDAEQGLAFVSCAQRAFGALDYVWKPHAADLIDHVSRGPLHISTMFRRTLWEAVGGFQEGLPADEEMDFWTSALALGFRGEVLDEPLLNYRVRAESMYHRLLQRETYVALRENFYEKHLKSLEPHFQELLLAKEALILEQRSHAKHLAATKVALEQEVASLRAAAKELAKSLANQNIPVIDWGDFGDREPISAYWGVDRGEPINRYYIIKFLQRHKSDICGHVLEVKDSFYTRSFGGDKVTQADVLDINPLNPVATVVADLTKADKIPSNRFDCFILTQTLNFIYDVQAALSHAMRILRPGGVLLASVSALDRISYETGPDGDYWRFTEASLRTLLAQHLPLDAFEISGFGNVAACAAYLYGLSSQEVDPKTLEVTDPWFPIGFCIRAVKPPQRDSKKRDTPLVSIVTAFYNAESFLAEAIESVLAQSYDNWELLLVDDGSKDGSTRIARQYANQHPEKIFYLEHHNHDNRGAAASRNYAIRCSKGQYVAILDADDVWFPHKLERQVVILGSEPRAAMVCGRSLYWYGWTEKPEDLQRDNAPDLGVQENRLYEPPELLKSFYPLGNGGAPCPSNILLRRNMMEK